jgi:CubicO group peptidase (beta-lactamase class C family)
MKLSTVRRKLERVNHAVEKGIERGELASAVVLARMGEELEYEGVFGAACVSPERHDATRDTIYDLASLTKVMATTCAVWVLVADGKLKLDQPVAELLPKFAERGKQAVLVRHLLTHSSGLRPWRAFYSDLHEREVRRGEKILATDAARELILKRILSGALVHEPGEAAVYGDLDFIVLGALIEAVSGERLDVFCQRRIYEPLGLERTRFNPVPFTGERRLYAATEQCPWREKVLWGEVHDGNAWAMGGVAGHAGLFAPASDVMRFGLAMLAAHRGESEIFSAELAQEFFRRQNLPEGSDWALGWDTPTPGHSTSGNLFTRDSVGHTGFTGTSLWIDLARGAVFVMLTNRVHLVSKRSRFELRPQVHDLVYEAFLAA